MNRSIEDCSTEQDGIGEEGRGMTGVPSWENAKKIICVVMW